MSPLWRKVLGALPIIVPSEVSRADSLPTAWRQRQSAIACSTIRPAREWALSAQSRPGKPFCGDFSCRDETNLSRFAGGIGGRATIRIPS